MDIKSIKGLVKGLNAVQRKINSLNKGLIKTAISANKSEVKNIFSQPALKRKIEQKDWQRLHSTSLNQFKTNDKNIDQLFVQVSERNQMLSKKSEIIAQIKPAKPLKNTKGWKERRKEIADQLKEQGIETKVINRYLKNIEEFDLKKYLELENKMVRRGNETIKDTFNKLLKSYIFHYYCYLCAQTNLNLTVTKRLTTIKSDVASLEKIISKQITLIKNLPAGDDIKIPAVCKSSEKAIKKNIEARLLPLALALYKTKIHSKKELDTKVELSLRTGMLIRRSILLLAACKRLLFDYLNKDFTPEFKQWQKGSAIKKIEVPAKVKSVRISSLNSKGNSYNKKTIAIKGKVKKITIRHVARKPISYAFISDGKKITRATIPHIKVDSGGMSPGAYVEITGKWLKKNKESFNKPSLAIDRIDNKQAANSSWLSWLSLRMNDVYQIMPHSLNARLSWKPGVNGAINPIKYSVI